MHKKCIHKSETRFRDTFLMGQYVYFMKFDQKFSRGPRNLKSFSILSLTHNPDKLMMKNRKIQFPFARFIFLSF